ncbi:unnamed protein product [Dovyalis caffra]|uniref:Uncharacterized protein n=1 Tax=Dovyalis caffra TaxID=77055 RepID=A0AAV1QQR8_9ROSI|nr:unnamed protein product [Dovyalis caffra]
MMDEDYGWGTCSTVALLVVAAIILFAPLGMGSLEPPSALSYCDGRDYRLFDKLRKKHKQLVEMMKSRERRFGNSRRWKRMQYPVDRSERMVTSNNRMKSIQLLVGIHFYVFGQKTVDMNKVGRGRLEPLVSYIKKLVSEEEEVAVRRQ